MKVFVTGAAGFVGRAVVSRLLAAGHEVTALTRRPVHWTSPNARNVIGDITDMETLTAFLAGHDAVVHLAARAHVLKDDSLAPLEAFRRVNRDATIALASAALEAGIGHFIHFSSIGVNGSSSGDAPFTENSPCNPNQAYAVSKREAEIGLRNLLDATAMALTIVRPPLVYGTGAPGNMRRLLGLVAASTPLPLAGAREAKSFVGVDNLADFVVLVLDKPTVANRLFLVADSDRFSTEQLVRAMAKGMGKPARLFALPRRLVGLASRTPGVGGPVRQLFLPLAVDNQAAQNLLGWAPAPTEEGVIRMARDFAAVPW